MFRIAFLRNIFLSSLLIALVLPLYDLLVVHPAYEEMLTKETRNQAERFADYLARSFHLAQAGIDRQSVSGEILREVELLRQDPELVKLRFFSRGGEIVFSTETAEIGHFNRHDYFTNIVGEGRIFSQVVRRNDRTADGSLAPASVVETYVPVMGEDGFVGAMEFYYDITARLAETRQLSQRSTGLILFLAAALFAVLWLTLGKARRSIEARLQAERALRQANGELEERVAERTGELLQANQQLSAEIAERTQAQVALRRAVRALGEDKERIDSIVRSLGEGLVVTDGHGRLVMVNPAAELLLGVAGRWRAGDPVASLFTEPRLHDDFQQLLAAAAAGTIRELELPQAGASVPTVVEARTSDIHDALGRPAGRITLLHDITQERTIERLKSEFVSMAAHELQTPLTAIIGYSELLLNDEVQFSPADRRDFLSYIYDKGEALARIVRDLLDLSRVESGHLMPLDKSVFSLAALVQSMVDQYRKRHPRHLFEIDLAQAELPVEADRNRLAQVLENVLSNAVKYSPGAVVRISGETVGDFYQITVADQGIGMSAEQLDRVFDKFYRVDNSNTAVPGIGLGMSIARYMVEAHGGRIWLESELGRGTKVHFTLPRFKGGQSAQAGRVKITDSYGWPDTPVGH
ncbi:MAG: PAS domain-containing protein [Desulfuromonadales bacterium]|nr:PAS domain-containing protein [Desulfuromonadales bacterium]